MLSAMKLHMHVCWHVGIVEKPGLYVVCAMPCAKMRLYRREYLLLRHEVWPVNLETVCCVGIFVGRYASLRYMCCMSYVPCVVATMRLYHR